MQPVWHFLGEKRLKISFLELVKRSSDPLHVLLMIFIQGQTWYQLAAVVYSNRFTRFAKPALCYLF
mgnify:FL=1